MSFISESLLILNRRAGLPLSIDAYLRIHTKANTDINGGHVDWYEQFLDMLSRETGKTPDVIGQSVDTWARIPECIKYIQLGNPELILIAGRDIESLMGRTSSVDRDDVQVGL